jgi:hypothetical protein
MEGSIDQPRYESFRDNPNPLQPAEGDAYIGQADYEALTDFEPSHTFDSDTAWENPSLDEMLAAAADPNDTRIIIEDGGWLGPSYPSQSPSSADTGFEAPDMRDGELKNYSNVAGMQVRVHWSALNVRDDDNQTYPDQMREGDTVTLSGNRERRLISGTWYTMYELEGGGRWIAGSGIEPAGEIPEQPEINNSDEWLTSTSEGIEVSSEFESLDTRTQRLVQTGMEYLRAREPRLNFILNEYGDNSIQNSDERLYQAIRSFQEVREITVDGIIGPVTKEHIRQAFNDYLS